MMAGDLTATDEAASLRAVLAAIDAGALEASESERAYLAGTVDALERIPEQTTHR